MSNKDLGLLNSGKALGVSSGYREGLSGRGYAGWVGMKGLVFGKFSGDSGRLFSDFLPDGALGCGRSWGKGALWAHCGWVWKDDNPEPFVNGAMVLAGRAWHYEHEGGNCPNGSATATATLTHKGGLSREYGWKNRK